MEQLKDMILEISKTSETLQAASEHMKRAEKKAEFNALRYKQAQEILEVTYERIKDDRILRLYFPELMEYFQKGE